MTLSKKGNESQKKLKKLKDFDSLVIGQTHYKKNDGKFGARERGSGQKDFFWGCRESGIIIVSMPQKTSSALLRVFDL